MQRRLSKKYKESCHGPVVPATTVHRHNAIVVLAPRHPRQHEPAAAGRRAAGVHGHQLRLLATADKLVRSS